MKLAAKAHAAGLLLMLAHVTGCACTNKQCLGTVVLVTDLAALEIDSMITACLDGQCASATYDGASFPPFAGPLAGALSVDLEASPAHAVQVIISGQSSLLHDGDLVSLRIDAPDESVTFERHWTADYAESYSNGESCGGPTCLSAELLP